jgi:hypothetical protein
LYLDRAADAWRAHADTGRRIVRVVHVGPRIEEGTGGILRPPEGSYRGADYDFISAIVQQTTDQGETIAYTIDTKRARTEVRAHAAQLPLIRSLILNASEYLRLRRWHRPAPCSACSYPWTSSPSWRAVPRP